jgi:hypothetical protein
VGFSEIEGRRVWWIGTSEVAAYERAERREGSVSEVRSVVFS